eukprot:scaffold3058_cov165-Ochromonas_danica.AAC.39
MDMRAGKWTSLLPLTCSLIWLILSAAEPYFANNRTLTSKKPTVLITGAGGFIGAHLSKHLQESGEVDVVGLDIFNNYYNPALKWHRVESLLVPAGVTLIEGDVCDDVLISSLMEKYQFIAIYHLAAQAGVRYSLKKPQAYVRENVKCFVSLIEHIRSYAESGKQAPRLLYASSSSVYGLSEAIPFSETDRVDKLSNLYGATKRMNEITAFAYHNLFNISSIGFRFFTVYGPWGRPDMAAYLFSDNILKGQPITVFNDGNLSFHFTYVEDIVAGLAASLKVPLNKPLVLNLGNNKPVQVMKFIRILEDLLGKKANIQYAVSKAEIPTTFANISLAQSLLGYEPKTNIEEGLKNFVEWYKTQERAAIPCESECVVLPDLCHSTGMATAAQNSRSFTRTCDFVIYSTAVDSLEQFSWWHVKAPKSGLQICYVLFSKPGSAANLSSPKHRRLLLHWKVIEVEGLASAESEKKLTHILKLTPGTFFASKVTYAMYVSSHIKHLGLLSRITDLLKPKDRIAMVVVRAGLKDEETILANNNTSQRQISAYEKYADDGICFKELLFDDSIIVHNLQSVAAKQLRCSWYHEFHQWPVNGQISGAFSLAQAVPKAQRVHACDLLKDRSSSDVIRIPIAVSNSPSDVSFVHVFPNKALHSREHDKVNGN